MQVSVLEPIPDMVRKVVRIVLAGKGCAIDGDQFEDGSAGVVHQRHGKLPATVRSLQRHVLPTHRVGLLHDEADAAIFVRTEFFPIFERPVLWLFIDSFPFAKQPVEIL